MTIAGDASVTQGTSEPRSRAAVRMASRRSDRSTPLHIRFTADDLARTRIGQVLVPEPRTGPNTGARPPRPHRAGLTNTFERERDRLAQVLRDGGVEALLSSLHPSISWRTPVLTVWTRHGEADLDLRGTGLTIVPSLCAPPVSPVSTIGGLERASPVLAYPFDPAAKAASADVEHRPRLGPRRLDHLMGRTRALVFAAIGEGGCTTTELADRSGTSLATASEHATVLRAAGLIATQRRGAAVRHDLTHLGVALLGPTAGT
jgi:DNA-binding transcriptional ArsR family regulator